MAQVLSYTALLSLSLLQLESMKGKTVSIQTLLGNLRGVVSGFVLDDSKPTCHQIIGFIVGASTTIKFSEIKSITIED